MLRRPESLPWIKRGGAALGEEANFQPSVEASKKGREITSFDTVGEIALTSSRKVQPSQFSRCPLVAKSSGTGNSKPNESCSLCLPVVIQLGSVIYGSQCRRQRCDKTIGFVWRLQVYPLSPLWHLGSDLELILVSTGLGIRVNGLSRAIP